MAIIKIRSEFISTSKNNSTSLSVIQERYLTFRKYFLEYWKVENLRIQLSN